jgi:hypothetical protein
VHVMRSDKQPTAGARPRERDITTLSRILT